MDARIQTANGKIIVAGGDARRRLEVHKLLEGVNYIPLSCVSYPEFQSLILDNILAILILYPNEEDTVHSIFSNNIEVIERKTTLLISASRADNNHIRSLKYKADEFLIEPSPSELLAAINQSLNEAPPAKRPGLLKFGDLMLDRDRLAITLRGQPLGLEPVHARLLEFLVLRAGKVFSRKEISDGVWGLENPVDERTVDVVVGRIRDSLRHKVAIDPIRTIRSVGYAFDEQFGKMSSLPKRRAQLKRRQAKVSL